MDLHDVMIAKLTEQKSLSALCWLIDHGREIEFLYRQTECFLSARCQSDLVSFFTDGQEQTFKTIEICLSQAQINGIPFLQAWQEVQIRTIF